MNFIEHLLPNFQHFGLWGYWIVLVIAFLESMAVIGTFVPGSIVMLFIGFLSSQGYLEPGDLIWFSSVGAILGDSFGYYLGTKGTGLFRNENKILKLGHLDRAKLFFTKHGEKSVFWGRFLGPIRPIIPFVAGLSKMNFKRFLLWNVISALLWSAVLILFGYFFGGAIKMFAGYIPA